MTRDVIICDTEFNSDRGWWPTFTDENGNRRPTEIIQIGALRIDAKTLDITGTYSAYVRPSRQRRLYDYTVNLTHITQDKVDAAPFFAQSYNQLRTFWRDEPFYAYGRDIEIFGLNMELNGIPVPDGWPTESQTSLMPYIHALAPETVDVNSGRLVEVLGIRDRNAEHNGLGDCYSIVETLRHLVHKRGAPNPFVG